MLIVTGAWAPQTNGVVNTLQSVIPHLAGLGHAVHVLHPGLFETWPVPSYPEIRFARNPHKLAAMIRDIRPDTIHPATEGPLGLVARWPLCRWLVPFTTSLHTKFPEYVHERTGLPPRLSAPCRDPGLAAGGPADGGASHPGRLVPRSAFAFTYGRPHNGPAWNLTARFHFSSND